MILVHTSVIIDFLKDRQNAKVDLFSDILERKYPWGINEFIFQEVLQGARDETEWTQLKAYLESVPFYFLKYGHISYENAARIHFDCRRGGVTVRSSIDLLIVETALENDVALLHNDGDFTNIQKVVDGLRFYDSKLA